MPRPLTILVYIITFRFYASEDFGLMEGATVMELPRGLGSRVQGLDTR